MARTTFIPPGPMPVPYRLADLAENTAPGRPDSSDIISVVGQDAPGRDRSSLSMQSAVTPRRRDKAETRERASRAVEHAVAVRGRTVEYGRDTHDARFREAVAELAGVAAANALPYLHPGDTEVAACAAAGRMNDTARRALKRAIARKAKA